MAKKKADPVGATVQVHTRHIRNEYGTVTAVAAGVMIEQKIPRSSRFTRTLFPYENVIAYIEGEQDDGAWAIVSSIEDVTGGDVVVADAETVEIDESGWYSVPQTDAEGNDLGTVMVNTQASADADVRIAGDAFTKEGAGNGAAKSGGKGGAKAGGGKAGKAAPAKPAEKADDTKAGKGGKGGAKAGKGGKGGKGKGKQGAEPSWND